MHIIQVSKEVLEEIKKEGVFHLITKDGNDTLVVKIEKRFGKGRRVRVVETGEVFDSVLETAYNYNVTASAIVQAIKEKRKCKGVSFEYETA